MPAPTRAPSRSPLFQGRSLTRRTEVGCVQRSARYGWTLFATALAIALTAGTAGASASEDHASFSLQPSPARSPAYFVFNQAPGTEATGTLQLANVGKATGTAIIYPVDATTAERGGAAYQGRLRPRKDVGGWLRLAASRVTLKPQQQALIPFTLRVPAHSRPGDHLGGVVAEDADEATSTHKSGQRGFQIRVRHLTIVAVQVRLPGPNKVAVRSTGVRVGKWGNYQTIQLGMRNTGTLIIKPTGTLVVRDSHRRVMNRAPLRIDTFLPNTAIQYPVFVKGHPLPSGTYTAYVTLHYGAHSTTRWRNAFTVTK
jgi:WxL Interacting Protein, peptidoglycan binding domain